MVKTVVIGELAQKQIRKLPRHIVVALYAWVEQVREVGLDEVRKVPGYHDEPLRGDRKGQRSVRLNRAYRAFYVLVEGRTVVEVIEVNKHKY